MLRENEWVIWHDSLPQHTKEYLKNQPLWHDCDLFLAGALGVAIGFIIGIIL